MLARTRRLKSTQGLLVTALSPPLLGRQVQLNAGGALRQVGRKQPNPHRGCCLWSRPSRVDVRGQPVSRSVRLANKLTANNGYQRQVIPSPVVEQVRYTLPLLISCWLRPAVAKRRTTQTLPTAGQCCHTIASLSPKTLPSKPSVTHQPRFALRKNCVPLPPTKQWEKGL